MEEPLFFDSPDDLYLWFEDNHLQNTEIWIGFWKGRQKCMKYEDVLRVAICFGWIDVILKRIDQFSYMRKFVKRNNKSSWSPRCKSLAEELLESGEMAKSGIVAVEQAIKNGQWEKTNRREETDLRSEFRELLVQEKLILELYNSKPPYIQKMMARYYFDAKQEATKKRRMDKIKNALLTNGNIY